jgi:hypothetical protein
MACLSERKAKRETRVRPWLTNSALRPRKPTHHDTPVVVAAEPVAPTALTVESLLFEEAVAEQLESLSIQAPSRIPRWVSRRPGSGCMTARAQSSDDKTMATSGSCPPAQLPVGGERARTSRIPIPRKLVERLRNKVKACRTVPSRSETCEQRHDDLPGGLGVDTKHTETARGDFPKSSSMMPRLKRVPATVNRLLDTTRGHGVKPKPTVKFAKSAHVVWIPHGMVTRECAPRCDQHQKCRSDFDFFTCRVAVDDQGDPLYDNPPRLSYEAWYQVQVERGNDTSPKEAFKLPPRER